MPPIAGIQMESVCRSPIVAVVGQQHRLASAGKLTLREIANERLVKLQVNDLPHWEWQVMMAWRSGKRSDASQLQVLETIRAMAPQWE